VTGTSRSTAMAAAWATTIMALIGVCAVTTNSSGAEQLPVVTVTVAPASNTAGIGQAVQLRATPKDAAGGRLIRLTDWTSSDVSVATVSNNGLVTAVAAGHVVITATAGGVSGTAQVTVTTAPASAPVAAATEATAPHAGGYATPDILDNGSFETGWDFFNNGAAVAPTGVTRDDTHAWSLRNVDAPGQHAVRRQFRITPPETGASMMYTFERGGMPRWSTPGPARQLDRVYARFYFYFDAAPNGTFKFQIYETTMSSDQFGGFYLSGGRIGWAFIKEWSSRVHPIVPLSGLVRGWHSLECDYWRNGDPSGYPSVAIWLDNVQVTHGIGGPPAPGAWIGGRLNAGQRRSSARIGTYNLLGILNGNPPNTVAGNVWVDRVSISTRGRIGP